MMRGSSIDRWALALIAIFFVLALVFAREQRYYSDAKPTEKITAASGHAKLREGMERRLAANALYEIGAVGILRDLDANGRIQVKPADEESTWAGCIGSLPKEPSLFYTDATTSILAIEAFNRAAIARWLKDEISWMAALGPGWALPFSLGPGQVKLKRFRQLLEDRQKTAERFPGEARRLPGQDDLPAQVSFLIDPCSNASAVAGIIEQEFQQLQQEERKDSPNAQPNLPMAMNFSELSDNLWHIAQRYNGYSRREGEEEETPIFDYAKMVWQAFELLASTHPCEYNQFPESEPNRCKPKPSNRNMDAVPSVPSAASPDVPGLTPGRR